AVEGRVCNLLQRMVAAEIVQHKLIKASTNIGHCHGLLRSYGKLNIPEYRLLAFINTQLGFRNFNAMLHKYRIEDVSEALANPENRAVPILTIALISGISVHHAIQ
ncbi:MAG: hypothetical protein OXE78_05375, partial [Gammaproteobacteria bacterium]|nr:hypothetical protein [Gammaproteobacteria bacterium]